MVDIPNPFGGFAPFPNTIATALLAYQSEAIGFGFGIKFQYAKRLIGAQTNEIFNALTPELVGGIVEQHNTELIQRMKNEMPKWLEIQKDYIEAGVQVELAKANRLPTAMAEIFASFANAFGEQQQGKIDDFFNQFKTPEGLNSLSNVDPILSLMALFNDALSPGGTEPPTTEPPSTETFTMTTSSYTWTNRVCVSQTQPSGTRTETREFFISKLESLRAEQVKLEQEFADGLHPCLPTFVSREIILFENFISSQGWT